MEKVVCLAFLKVVCVFGSVINKKKKKFLFLAFFVALSYTQSCPSHPAVTIPNWATGCATCTGSDKMCSGCTAGNSCTNGGCCIVAGSGCDGCKTCCQVTNPEFNKQCAFNAVLLLDNTISISDSTCTNQVRPSVTTLVNALLNVVTAGGSVYVGVQSFDYTPTVVFDMAFLTPTYAQNINNWVSGSGSNNGRVNSVFPAVTNYPPYCSCKGGTNWAAALIMAADFSWAQSPDVFIWFTDGMPEYSGSYAPQTSCSASCYSRDSDIEPWKGICNTQSDGSGSYNCDFGCGSSGLSCTHSTDHRRQGLWASCTAADYLKSQTNAKLFLVGVGGNIGSNENKVQLVTGRNRWDKDPATFKGADYIIDPNINNLGDILVAVVAGICNCLQSSIACRANGNSCDIVQWSARVRVTTLATGVSTTFPGNAVTAAYVYYRYEPSPDTRVRYDFFAPGTLVNDGSPSVVRSDIQFPCTVTREVTCGSGCYKVGEKQVIPRFFRETGESACTQNDCGTTYSPPAGCTGYQKLYPQPPFAATTQEMIQYVWTQASGAPCAGMAFDGTLYEFFQDSALSVGVNAAIPPQEFPGLSSNANFDPDPSCEAQTCARDVELVFVVDEQSSCSSDYSNIKAYVKAVIDTFNLASGSTKFGIAYTQSTGAGQYSQFRPTSLTSQNLQAWDNDIAAHTQAAGAGPVDFPLKISEALDQFWGSANPSLAKRELLTIVCGSDAGNAGSLSTMNSKLTQYGVEHWAVGVGFGASETTLLTQISASAGFTHFHAVGISANLLSSSELAFSSIQLCPQGNLCGDECLGFCSCVSTVPGSCKCPTCVEVQTCTTFECLSNAPDAGCVGSPKVCNPPDNCFTAACNPATGNCVNTEKVCNDTNPCTVDTCVGDCNYVQVGADFCDDGDPCTNDFCTPFVGCQHTPVVCEDNNPCTNNTCDGGCNFPPYPASYCDDGNPCTNDFCDPNNGGCQHPDKVCNDFSVCTDDSCDANGNCQFVTKNITEFCDDQNACTIDGCTKEEGCVHTSRPPCTDNNLCTQDSCSPSLGCVFSGPTSCDQCETKNCPSDSCNTGLCIDTSVVNCVAPTLGPGETTTYNQNDCEAGAVASGYCYNVTRSCDDNNVCTTDSCDPGSGCINTNKNCDLGDKCKQYFCDPVTDCYEQDISGTCVTSNKCLANTCEPSTGCNTTDISSTCVDGNACTLDGVCDPSLGCIFNNITCDDGNPCTIDSCDAITGCKNDPVVCQNTTCLTYACSAVQGGACVVTGSNLDCDDSNSCTIDRCVEGVGCTHEDFVCPRPFQCFNYQCFGDGPDPNCTIVDKINCDDGSNCTTDSCVQAIGCLATDIVCSTTNECSFLAGCDNQTGACEFVTAFELYDSCGVCRGDGFSCAGVVGLAVGVIAAIVVAAVVAAVLFAFLSKKGYDYYQARSDISVTGAQSNPFFTQPSTQGEFNV